MYSLTNITYDLQLDSIILLHYFDYAKNFYFPGETHDFWEFVFVDKGEVYVCADDNQPRVIHTGEAVFHRPNEFHKLWTGDEYASAAVISFTSHSPAMDFFEHKLLTFNKAQKRLISLTLEEGLLAFEGPLNFINQKELKPSANKVFGAAQLVKTYIEQLLISLIRTATPLAASGAIAPIPAQFDNEIVARVMDILNRSIFSSIALDDVFHDLPWSPSMIRKVFKDQIGYSAMQMFTKMKMEKAKQLLSEQHYNVTEISEALGYSSIHYFSRVFKKEIGVSPSNYAETIQSLMIL